MDCVKPNIVQKLKLNESKIVPIIAKCKWNDTGIIIEKGTYIFESEGKWTDLNIECDANGFNSTDPKVPWYSQVVLKLGEKFRRQPGKNWFRLIGCLDNEKMCFDIGKNKKIYFSKGGRLFCYANDVPLMYNNNKGLIKLKIIKISNEDIQENVKQNIKSYNDTNNNIKILLSTIGWILVFLTIIMIIFK